MPSPRAALRCTSKLCSTHAEVLNSAKPAQFGSARFSRVGHNLEVQLPGRVQFGSARFSQVSLPGARQFQIVPNPRSTSRLSPTLELHFQTVPSLRSTSKLCPAREKWARLNCAQPARSERFQIVPNPRKTSKLCPTRELHFQIAPSLREAGTFPACRAREKPALLNCAQPAQQIMPNPRAALPNCAEPTQHFQIVPSLREAGASKSCPAREKRALPNYS